jgi:DHA1 family bicyclomycin/chloramphenicol resistance-like MFS transporter
MKSFKILAILVLAFIAFAVETDVYVPSFPDMVKAFGVSETQIQKLLSYNFLGICLSCLFSGPLSDSFGRKRVLSGGTALFALASVLCYFSNQFDAILFGRFIQGLGAGTILAVSSTCIFDLYEPTKSGQLVAILNSVVTISMSLAPLVGVWLNTQFGWRSCFLFILGLATLSWITITFFLPETHPVKNRHAFKAGKILKSYVTLFRNRRFILGSFTWSLMVTALIVYTANVSLLFIDHLKMTEGSFGFYQAITMGSFGLFSLLCSYLIGKLGGRTVKIWGTALFFSGILALIAINHFIPTSPFLISTAMAVVAAGTSLAIIVYFTDSMVGITSAGAAMSLVQGLRLFLSAEFTDLSRVMFDGTLGSVVMVIAGVGLLTLICILCLPKPSKSKKPVEAHVMI